MPWRASCCRPLSTTSWEDRLRNPEDLIAIYESEQAEREDLKAQEEILLLLQQPGWKRFQNWLSGKRDDAFQQLRAVQGTRDIIGESFLRWQTVDRLYEDIEAFIRNTVEQCNEILRRRQTTLEEEFIKEQIHGRHFSFDPDAGRGAADP